MALKKTIRIGLIFAIILGISNVSFAQLKKANTYFEKGEYSAALTYYNKVLKKDANNKEATQKIAYAYRKLKKYKKAEMFYAKATSLNPNEISNYLYYGQTLKNNNKIEEAKIQFQKIVDKDPSSLIGKQMLNSCIDIQSWAAQKKEFEAHNVPNINSEKADFCPVFFKDGLIFVSERGSDLADENNFGVIKKPYLSIFYAKKDNEFKQVKDFSSQISTLYHDGPVSISSDKKLLYFSRVEKEEQGKNYINRIKIYSATLDGEKWKDITPFEHNNSDYSVGHPSISKDGRRLFFASDMPGGEGGMDIYVSERIGEIWGKPINLGRGVNTPENEVFPYFREGLLYFSSEGHSGYGGLDIFSVAADDLWQNAVNLKSPINSSKDDFGIFYKDDENGYFSSDRDGGLGSDDIYRFVWHTSKPQTEMSGVLEYEKLAASGTTINLLDEDGNVIRTVITDEYGNFKFDKLDLENNYMLFIEANDDSFLENVKLFMTNSAGEKVLLANKLSKEKYTFKALPYTYYDELEQLVENDESLFTVDIIGQIYRKLPGDYSNEMEIWLVDEDGNVIGKSVSNKEGKFLFKRLSLEEKYFFMLAEDDEELNIVILNKEDEIIEMAKRLIDGKYRYTRLDADVNVVTLINEVDETITIFENENFTIPNILYGYDSYEINEVSAKELDKLVLILKKNKHIEVELSSHTDSKGGNDFNIKLSQKRVDAAVQYVVSKGVDKEKVTGKGFGESRPIAPNNIGGVDSPEGRAKNRRTEFKIIKLK